MMANVKIMTNVKAVNCASLRSVGLGAPASAADGGGVAEVDARPKKPPNKSDGSKNHWHFG